VVEVPVNYYASERQLQVLTCIAVAHQHANEGMHSCCTEDMQRTHGPTVPYCTVLYLQRCRRRS
jgi:hypothetical protein